MFTGVYSTYVACYLLRAERNVRFCQQPLQRIIKLLPDVSVQSSVSFQQGAFQIQTQADVEQLAQYLETG